MFDKDLDNIAIIPSFFKNSTTLLCTFHVIKYMKAKIYEHVKETTRRVNLIQYFRQLLYSRSENGEPTIELIKNASNDAFYNFLNREWAQLSSNVAN